VKEPRTPEKILVSACLLGVRCRYDGTSRYRPELLARLSGAHLIPVCPEQLGGLTTPRSPCRFEGGSGEAVLAGRARLVDDGGADRTENFIRGAEEAARIARELAAGRAVLKAGSPSCDLATGVAAARLRAEGLRLESVE
jgi:uncharacterized protein YbbK (DUF523 family)